MFFAAYRSPLTAHRSPLTAYRSLQPDFAVERDAEPDLVDGELHARGEALVILELAVGDGFGDGALDLGLRPDTDGFEELADAHVESLFVHGFSPLKVAVSCRHSAISLKRILAVC